MKNAWINIVTILLFVAATFAQPSPTPKPAKVYFNIAAGETAERELEAGKRHNYLIHLEAGQFVRVEAEQKGCDVIFALYFKGENYFDVNNSSEDKTEVASGTSDKAGDYELQVVSMSGKTGSYRLRIAEIREATVAERDFSAGIVNLNGAFLKATSSSTETSIREAIALNKTALARFEAAGERSYVARANNEIGGAYAKIGDFVRARDYFQRSLAVGRAIGDKREMSLALSNIAAMYQREGEWQKSYDTFLESLSLRIEIVYPRGELHIYNELGKLLTLAGDGDRALEYYQRALDINRKHSISQNLEADTYENFGLVYLARNDNVKARESFERALEIAQKTKSRRREASYLNSLARTQMNFGDGETALKQLDQALAIAVELGDASLRASILGTVGLVRTERNEPVLAIDALEQSLAITRKIEDGRSTPQTLLMLAHAELMKGSVSAAQTRSEEAIDALEQLRSRVESTDIRDSFSANLQEYYGLYVEILMARHRIEPNAGFAKRAFEASERSRARGLLSRLGESNLKTIRAIPTELVRRDREVKGLLASRLEVLTRLLGGKPDAAKVADLRAEIEQIRLQDEEVAAQIRAVSPRYAELSRPATPNLEEIQRTVIDDDSVLLEYSLGERASYLWIVTKNTLNVVELPSRSRIERATGKLMDAMTARNQQPKFETAEEFRTRVGFADADLDPLAAELGQMVLGPAAAAMQGKRVIVVADGALQNVPFAALRLNGRYVVESNETVSLPSASVLAAVRRDSGKREPAPKTVAIFADPIFSENDPRIATAVAREERKVRFQKVSGSLLRDGLSLDRLPFTRREADFVGALVPAAMQSKRLDFDANRDNAQSPELAQYRYIHFATHGFVNTELPEYSGIVLSLFDERGEKRDGVLRAADIYGMSLNAEMVVLSGCRTAFGRQIKGEGLGGLTRGFFFAGARRVTVSLWDVSDEATAELMGQFYREVLGARKLSPAAALRQAQIAMIRGRKWKNPYFWAAFIMQGEPQ